APSGKRLIVSRGESLDVWDVVSCQRLWTLKAQPDAGFHAVSRDGRRAAEVSSRVIAVGEGLKVYSKAVAVSEIGTDREIFRLVLPEHHTYRNPPRPKVSLSRDGKRIAVSYETFVWDMERGKWDNVMNITVSDVDTGRELFNTRET